MAWTIPYRWVNDDLVDSLDMNEFLRDNLLFLRDEAFSSRLISINESIVIADNRNPEWKTISEFFMTTYGKQLYSSIEFSVNNGVDTWGPGTIVVGEGDTTDIVEKVGERITRVAIRDGYTRSSRWQSLLRQRQQQAKLIEDIKDAIEAYRNVDSVFGYGAPPGSYASIARGQGHDFSSRDERILSWLANRYGNSGGAVSRAVDDVSKQERKKDEINDAMRREGVVWRHKDILHPGRDQSITESSNTTRTRVISSTENITYDKVFVRLLVNGTLSRELIHDGDDRTESGTFYLYNVPAGQHHIQLQWRSPQFTGSEPLSGVLISLSNLNFQIKEVRYELLDEIG